MTKLQYARIVVSHPRLWRLVLHSVAWHLADRPLLWVYLHVRRRRVRRAVQRFAFWLSAQPFRPL